MFNFFKKKITYRVELNGHITIYLNEKIVGRINRENFSKVVHKETITETKVSNCWHVLGIMPSANRDKVSAAYKKMAMVYHPDHGGSSASFILLGKCRDSAYTFCEKNK
jgi:hypothetical protein